MVLVGLERREQVADSQLGAFCIQKEPARPNRGFQKNSTSLTSRDIRVYQGSDLLSFFKMNY